MLNLPQEKAAVGGYRLRGRGANVAIVLASGTAYEVPAEPGGWERRFAWDGGGKPEPLINGDLERVLTVLGLPEDLALVTDTVATGTPTLAVIDGNEGTADLLRSILRYAGFAVAGLNNGVHAEPELAAAVLEAKAALVLFDVAPPYDDSWALLRLLRQDTNRRVAYLALTTAPDEVSELAGEDNVEILGKPFELDDLLGAVERALRRAGFQAGSPS